MFRNEFIRNRVLDHFVEVEDMSPTQIRGIWASYDYYVETRIFFKIFYKMHIIPRKVNRWIVTKDIFGLILLSICGMPLSITYYIKKYLKG